MLQTLPSIDEVHSDTYNPNGLLVNIVKALSTSPGTTITLAILIAPGTLIFIDFLHVKALNRCCAIIPNTTIGSGRIWVTFFEKFDGGRVDE